MEIILLLIYSFFVWLVFFKFKWLPWNFVSQIIVVSLPIFAMTALIPSGSASVDREGLSMPCQ